MNRNPGKRRGSTTVEMSLVLIPFFFMLLGCVELTRAMWTYHTLNSAVKKANRVAAVHGARCVEASPSCQASVGSVSKIMRHWGIGLDPNQVRVTYRAGNLTLQCNSLTECLGDGTRWPAPPADAAGLPVTIDATYPFRSVVSSFWPGGLPAVFQLRAHSTETIQF